MRRFLAISLASLLLVSCDRLSTEERAALKMEYDVAVSEFDRAVSSYERAKHIIGANGACDGNGEQFVRCGHKYNANIEKLASVVVMKSLDKTMAYDNYVMKLNRPEEINNAGSLEHNFESIMWMEQKELDAYIANCWLSKRAECFENGMNYVEVISTKQDSILEAKGEYLKWSIARGEAQLKFDKEELFR